MKVEIVRGTKQQIAETVVRIPGEVREAIVFVEEPSDSIAELSGEDIFAEMEPFTVRVGDVDDSREAIYTRMEGE
jgi:hypothetical protein